VDRKEKRNAGSTLKRGILVSGNETHVDEKFPKKELETLWATAAGRASDDAGYLVITRRKNSFLMMNRYPYIIGQLMAVPYRKVAELSALGWGIRYHGRSLSCMP
jgi:hypothetical protein